MVFFCLQSICCFEIGCSPKQHLFLLRLPSKTFFVLTSFITTRWWSLQNLIWGKKHCGFDLMDMRVKFTCVFADACAVYSTSKPPQELFATSVFTSLQSLQNVIRENNIRSFGLLDFEVKFLSSLAAVPINHHKGFFSPLTIGAGFSSMLSHHVSRSECRLCH